MDLDKFLEKHEMADRHSFFQLKYFVIGKEPTIQGKLWQCLREIKDRKESLEALALELEERKDDLELTQLSCAEGEINGGIFGIDANPKIKEINLRKLKRQEKAMEKTIEKLKKKEKNLKEELVFFLKAFESLEKTEPFKPFDDEQAQIDYWSEKLSQKLNMKLLLQSKIDIDIAETILALPSESSVKKQLIQVMERQQNGEQKKIEVKVKNDQ